MEWAVFPYAHVLVLIPYPQFPIKQLVPFLSDNVPLLEMECEKSDYDDDGDDDVCVSLVCLSFCLSIRLSEFIHQFISSSVYPSVYQFIHQFIFCLSIRLSCYMCKYYKCISGI